MSFVCYKNFSLDDTTVNNLTVWCKIEFVGVESDLSASRIVLVFNKSFFTDNETLDNGHFATSKVFYTVEDAEIESISDMLYNNPALVKDSIMDLIIKLYESKKI